MKFEHRFRVKAPVDAVAAFHRRSASMAAITPPPLIVRVHAAPPELSTGDRMAFTLWAGPIPLRWEACIEDASSHGFTDRQISGPFASWVHRHEFERVDDRTTDVVDQVEVRFRKELLFGVIGRLMWFGLPLLFAYRGWRTRRLLAA